MITYNAEVINNQGKVLMYAPWDCVPDALDLLLEYDVISLRESQNCTVMENKEAEYTSFTVDVYKTSYTVNFKLPQKTIEEVAKVADMLIEKGTREDEAFDICAKLSKYTAEEIDTAYLDLISQQ